MRNFITNIQNDDRGDQLVGWVMLVSFVVLVGAGVWTQIGDNVGAALSNVAVATNLTGNDDAESPGEDNSGGGNNGGGNNGGGNNGGGNNGGGNNGGGNNGGGNNGGGNNGGGNNGGKPSKK
jgi:hypothetical protein